MSAPAFKKVIVLGIDGLDPNTCRRLMAAGRLPNLSALAAGGTFSPLGTVNPPQSPVAWSTIATGANPGVHGVYDFIIRDPKTYLPDLSMIRLKASRFGFGGGQYVPPVKATPFWERAAEAGAKATVVRWPVTFPAQGAGVRMLSGLGTPDVRGTLGHYSFYVDQPQPPGEESRGRVVEVTFENGRAESSVQGPMTSSFGRRSSAEVKLTLQRRDDRLVVKAGPQEIALQEGRWSDWLGFDFDIGLRGEVKGIGRFYLTSLNPLGLYLTPIQIAPSKPCFPFSQPEDYAAELARVIGGPYATLGMPEETKALSEEKIPDEAFLEMCRGITIEREKMFDYELGRLKEGLLAFVFDTSDRIQHMFWRLVDKDHPLYDAAQAQRLGPVIDEHYVWMDRVVGRAVEAGDDKTALLICSDHGFASYTRSVHLNAWLAQNGFLRLQDHDPADPGELFKYVDWPRTEAYALGFGSIYLNLEGREKEGRVKPGPEAEKKAQKIAAGLKALKDPPTNRPVVHRVFSKAEIYSGPLTDQAPELVVGYNAPFRVSWTTAIGGTPAEVFKDNLQKWSGDHCIAAALVPGSLFSNLKLKVTPGPPHQSRLAATSLKLLGLEPAAEMAEPLI